MNLCEARQSGYRFIDLGIVLHGAGAERVKLALDSEVSLRQNRKMAQHFELAQFGKPRDIVAPQRRRNAPFNLVAFRRPVERASSRRAALEEQLWRRGVGRFTVLRWF